MTISGASLSDVLKEIGKQTGQKLEARGPLLSEVLCIRLIDADAGMALEKIAGVVGGEWRAIAGTQVLVASPDSERREREVEREAQRANIQTALDQELAEMKKRPVFNERTASELAKAVDGLIRSGEDGSAEFYAATKSSPTNRLLLRLLASIPVDSLTGWPDGSRVVFSDRPTRMQRALPFAAGQAIQTFIREQSFWQVAAAASVPDTAPPNDVRRVRPLPDGFKVNVAVEDWEDSPGFSAVIQVLGPDGKSLSSCQVRLNGESDKSLGDIFRPIEPQPGEKTVVEDAESAELRKLVEITQKSEQQSETKRSPVLAKWRSRMENPAKYEPLGYVPGNLWIKVAEARNANLVANAYEESFSSYGDEVVAPQTPTVLLRGLARSQNVEEREGWITIRPRFLHLARRDRVDRVGAGILIQASLRTGGVRIDDVAQYMAHANQHNGLLAWDGGYLRAFFRGSGPRSVVRTIAARDEMRFYGLLSPEQRSALTRRAIRLGDLSPEAKDQLERMVYWNLWLSGDSELEPTEALPNGIPSDGTLRLVSDTRETLVLPSTEGQPITARNQSPYTAARLGRLLGNPTSTLARDWNRFRVATGHTLTFRLDFGPGLGHGFDLYELLNPNGPAVRYEDLPDEFRTEVETARLAAAKQGVASPTQTSPPPP